MQTRARVTRDRLLAAAAEVFAANGYAGTSLTEIHERAGVTKGAIYFHYPSKESVAADIVRRQYERWPGLVARYTAEGADPFVTMVALTFAVARELRDEPLMRAGMRLALERSGLPADLPRPFADWQETIAGILRAADLAGDLTPEVVARVVVGTFFGVQHVSDMLTGREDVEDRLTELWLTLLPGVQRRPSAQAVIDEARMICRAVGHAA